MKPYEAVNFMYVNYVLFWFSHVVVSPLREIALISEKEWRKGIPRRARIHKVIRLLSVWRT